MGLPNPPEKHRSAHGFVCLSSAALALSACRVGADELSPAPPPSASLNPGASRDSRAHPMGELGRAHDYVMSVDSVKDCATDEVTSGKKPRSAMGVEVDIQGTSDLQIPANVFYATAEDANGDRYVATLTGCEPGLPALLVTRGHSAHGFITFEVPKLSRNIEVHYAPPVVGRGTEELRFSVAR